MAARLVREPERQRVVCQRMSQRQQIEDVIDMHVRYDHRIQRPEVGVPPQLLQCPRSEIEDQPRAVRLDEQTRAAHARWD